MLESDFKKKHLEKFLLSVPMTWFFEAEMAYGPNGRPDIVGVCNGRFFAIEVKRSEKQADTGSKSAIRIRLQQWTLGKIKESNGLTYTVYPENFEEFKKQFTEDTK
jgi:hypothetical protein